MKSRALFASVLGGLLALFVLLVVAVQAMGPANLPAAVSSDTQTGDAAIRATTVITMAHRQGAEFLLALEYQVLLYETLHPDVDVRLYYEDDLYGLMQSGSPPVDIYPIDVIWPGDATANGWIIPLDTYVSGSSIITLTDFLTGTVDAMTVDGQLMAIPLHTDAGLLYYRSDLLASYTYTYPRTFDELKTQALTIKSGEGLANGFVWQGAEYEGLTCDFLEYLWGSGGEIFQPPCRVVLSSTQAIQALDTMIDYIDSGASPAAVVTYAEEDARQAFQNGDAVFMRNWPYAWSLLQDDGSPVKGKVGIAPMPHAPGEASAATLGGWSLAISRHSAHPDAAFAFIEFMTDRDQQKYNALQISLNPTRMALYEDTEICTANPFMCDLLDVFVGARPRPAVADYVAFSAILQEEVHDALVGNQTSAEAIANAQDRLQSVAACGTYLPLIHRNQE